MLIHTEAQLAPNGVLQFDVVDIQRQIRAILDEGHKPGGIMVKLPKAKLFALPIIWDI